jgi:hypothetical protein
MVSKSILNGVKSAVSKIAKNSASAGRAAQSNTYVREFGKGFANAGGMMVALGTVGAITEAARRRKAQQAYDNKSKLRQFFSSRP